MELAIVTGVSRGLGEYTAKLLMKRGVHVLGISRSKQDLSSLAEENGVRYLHLVRDLSNLAVLESINEEITKILKEEAVEKLYLVNNAAMIDPIHQGMYYEAEELAKHVQINTLAPMVLMNHCLKKGHSLGVAFTGVTITSGAAERPIYGWSAYCSTKASINMYTETVGLEQEMEKTKNKIFAFSPGVMDTNMQKQIRSSSADQFKDVESFRQYKKSDSLRDPKEVGEVLVKLLLSEDLVNGKVYYVTDYE